MASDADTSTVLTSGTSDPAENASQTSKTKKNQAAATTWAHTREPREDEAQGLKYCIYCDSPAYKSTVTTNMRKHLASKHNIIVDRGSGAVQTAAIRQLQELYSRIRGSKQLTEIDTMVLRGTLNQDVIDEALVSLIVTRNLAFRISAWPEFHTFCQALNPESTSYISTSHSQIPKKIDRCWQTHKDILRRKLQSALSNIHLSLDIWTSPNRLLLLGICAHFVDRDREKRSKAMLALRRIENHSGDAQCRILLPVLKNYGIIQKLGSIVSDNASTNDTLCQVVEDSLIEEGIQWNSIHNRLRCTGHIINLAVQAFLFQDFMEMHDLESYDKEEERGFEQDDEATRKSFRLLGPLGKLHNIVVHIRSSPGRTEEFKRMAGRMIPLDNRTRWNSWYDMLFVSNEEKNHVDEYTKFHLATLREDYLTPENWERLHAIQIFLSPFKRATLHTEGDRASIDNVLFTMDVLLKIFEGSLREHAADPELSSRIQSGWKIFDKYYSKTDDSPLYAAALILHPNRRIKYIDANWKKKWIKPTMRKVTMLWESYREKMPIPVAASLRPRELEQESELDMFDRVVQGLNDYNRPQSQDEFEDYCHGDPYDIGQQSPLEWWCQDQQRKRWPRLWYMAVDILSIPAMSDEPERIFSGARRTISWERSQLAADTVEKLECLKHWKLSGITENLD